MYGIYGNICGILMVNGKPLIWHTYMDPSWELQRLGGQKIQEMMIASGVTLLHQIVPQIHDSTVIEKRGGRPRRSRCRLLLGCYKWGFPQIWWYPKMDGL